MNKQLFFLLCTMLLAACASEDPSVATATIAPAPELTDYLSPTVTLAVAADSVEATATPLPLPTVTPIYVEIQGGDTLLGVASRYGITLDALLAANPGLDPQFLRVGTVIEVPRVDEEGIVVSAPQATAIPLPISAPDCRSDAVGGVWCVLEVNNEQAADMENVVVLVQLVNADGKAVATKTGTLLLNRLPVGETWPVLVHFPPPVAIWQSASAQLNTALPVTALEGRYLTASLSEIAIVGNADGKAANVSGVISLVSEDTPAEAVFVMLVAYGAEGNVVGVARWSSDESLAVGAGMEFSAWVYSLGPAIVDVVGFVEALP